MDAGNFIDLKSLRTACTLPMERKREKRQICPYFLKMWMHIEIPLTKIWKSRLFSPQNKTMGLVEDILSLVWQ